MFFRFIFRHRLLVLGLILLGTVGFVSQLGALRMDPDTEAFVPKHHPVRVFWDEAKERFGLGGRLLVAVVADGPDGIFTPPVLRLLTDLTEQIKDLDHVLPDDVRSLANSEAIVGTENGLDVIPFWDSVPSNLEQARAVRAKVLSNGVFLDRLVSRDGSIGVILVKVDWTSKDHSEVYREIARLIEGYHAPGVRILIAGSPAVEAVYGKQMAADLQRLIPLSLMVVVVVLFLCFPAVRLSRLVARAGVLWLAFVAFRGLTTGQLHAVYLLPVAVVVAMLPLRGVLLPSLVVVLSVLWTWGLQAILDVPIYISGIIMPPILLAIGCADGIHIMERYLDNAELGRDREQVIVRTMEELWKPVVLTSVTTAAGFASLATASMTAHQVLGVFASFGIIVAMVMSLTLIPALLAIMPLPEEQSRRVRRPLVPRLLIRLGEIVEQRRLAVALTGVAVMLLFFAGATRLRVDYSWVESLQEGTPVLDADRYLRTRHGGTIPLDVIVRAAPPRDVKDPVVLRAMDKVLAKLAEDPEVGDTRSIAEYIKRMNQAMNEDRPEQFRIPDSRDLVAQYLLLYSMSGDPAEYDDMVDYDYRAANLSILLRSDSMSTLNRVMDRLETLLDENLRGLEGVTATVTGSAKIQYTVMSLVFRSQVTSLTTAALLIFLTLWLLFRSLRAALLCMVPPAFAAVMNFGFMGMLGIPLGPMRAMVSAIALGIGVDYSIHLMARFRAMIVHGMSVDEAIVEAMRTSGRAILFNAVVVAAGFTVLAFSRSPSNVSFGVLIATNMATSALGALTLLPAGLAMAGPGWPEKRQVAAVEPKREAAGVDAVGAEPVARQLAAEGKG